MTRKTIALALLLTASTACFSTEHAHANDAPPRPATVYGFGNDLPLSTAVKMIAPSTVHATFSPGVSQNMHVSWTGGETWQDTLTKIAKTHDLSLSIAGDQITFDPKTSVSTQSEKKTEPTHPKIAKTSRTTRSRVARNTRTHTRHTHTASSSRTSNGRLYWNGTGKYDSPTIDQVSGAEALAMTNPIAGDPLIPGSNYADQYDMAERRDHLPSKTSHTNYNPADTSLIPGPDTPYDQASPSRYGNNGEPIKTYIAYPNEQIYQIITRWAKQSGEPWQVQNDTYYSMQVKSRTQYTTTFEDAVSKLIASYRDEVNPVVYGSSTPAGKIIKILDTEHDSPSRY